MSRYTRPMPSRALSSIALVCLVAACSAESNEGAPDDTTTEDELVGGIADLRFSAAGYLAHGATPSDAARARVSCGATLVSPTVVVTAAHCVQSAKNDVWVFGTGNAASGAPIRVKKVTIHPEFHEAPETKLDVRYYLRNFDVATLELERAPTGIVPAALPTEKTAIGCGYRAIGYRAETSAPAIRRSTRACVQFRLDLGGDPIFEVHPVGLSALCHGDGDEGSALVADAPDAPPVLHGIYVGSVTQGLTDCRRGTQYLNGYESMFGFRDFVRQSISAATP